MTRSRLVRAATIGFAAALCAMSAQAQAPAVTGASARSAGTVSPRKASTARIRAAAKSPVEAIEARGSNPKGPFARLSEGQRDSIIENSRSLLGIKYKWAGSTPERGLDCSGLVQYVFAKFGINLPHHAADLAKLGSSVAKDTSEMQVGDLLVFSKLQSKRISHVGIYVGDGMMVHASVGSKGVAETPVLEYRSALLRGVRRVITVDSTDHGSPQQPEQPERR